MKIRFLMLLIPMLVSGCATQYDSFRDSIKIGMKESEVIRKLDGIHYTYYTCEEATKVVNSEGIGCKKENAIGLYYGNVNDGAYLLGMGSSDVSFEIEINTDHIVTDIRLHPWATFF